MASPAQREEINLRRLLAYCEAELTKVEAAGSTSGRRLLPYQRLATFANSAAERVRKVKSEDPSINLATVESRLRSFQAALSRGMTRCSSASKAAASKADDKDLGLAQIVPEGLRKRRNLRAELLDTPSKPSTGQSRSGGDVEAVLQHNRKLQEAMTDDMVDLARGLKQQAMATSDILAADKEVLEDTEELAEKNEESLGRASEELRRQIEENGGCWVWLNLLVVFVVFALTIIFIKFTNFLP